MSLGVESLFHFGVTMDRRDEWEWILTGRDPSRGRRVRGEEKRKRIRLRRLSRALIVVMVVLLLLGISVFGWVITSRHSSESEQEMMAATAVQEDPLKDLSSQGDAYNRNLLSKPQIIGETLGDAGDFSFKSDKDYWGSVDYGDGVMGQLLIPKIAVNMPIRHGADALSLESGVGHLHGTSLPVGGSNTHSVLTGHTGEANKVLFSRLNEMVKGDFFYIKTGNRTLAYQVVGIRTVLPKDTDKLKIQDGKDLVTLVTCTPIFVNSHRLLVTGERRSIPNQAPEPEEAEYQYEMQIRSSRWWQPTLLVILVGMVVSLIYLRNITPRKALHRRPTTRHRSL